MTTARYILAAISVGLGLRDLDMLTVGIVSDICLERSGTGYTEVDAAGADAFFTGR